MSNESKPMNQNPDQPSAASGCSATVTKFQRDILYHAEHRAPGGYYCGGGPEMDALVAAGLMEDAGMKSFVPDKYYRITSRGRTVLRESPLSNPGSNRKTSPND